MSDGVTTIVVLDTETTDMDPDLGAEVIEIGWVALAKRDIGWEYVAPYWTFVESTAKMAPAARAAHHIHPYEVAPGAPDCISREAVIHNLLAAEEPGEMVYCAHNAPFDFKFLPELSLPVIDTYQCAKHIWPDAPKFGNQVLRYYLDAEPPSHLLQGLAPHRALYDAACTAAVLQQMLTKYTPTELVRLSTTPILLKTCGFGKHNGKPWSEVPSDYLSWMVRSSDMYQNDPEIKYTVDHYLNQGIRAI